MPDLDNVVAVVTGSNTGIGRTAATELLRRGATVVFVCRSEDKGRAAMADAVARTGNERVEYQALDLGDLASVPRPRRRSCWRAAGPSTCSSTTPAAPASGA